MNTKKTTVQVVHDYSVEFETPNALRRAIAQLRRCPFEICESYSAQGFYRFKRKGHKVVKGAIK